LATPAEETAKLREGKMSNDNIVVDTPEGIAFFQLCARRGALKLELVGMKRRGRSAYSICKEVYGLKGNRESVLKQLDEMIVIAQVEQQERRRQS
jgi:hypothetical protein